VVVLSEPVSCVPLVATCPLHPPEAVQEVEFSELHVRTDVPPGATTDGLAVSVAIGTVVTSTVAVAASLLPPRAAAIVIVVLGLLCWALLISLGMAILAAV